MKGEELSNRQPLARKSSPPPRCYTMISSPHSEILSYIKVEAIPPILHKPSGCLMIPRETRIYIAIITVAISMTRRIAII